MRGSQMMASAISHISYNMLRLHATAMLRHRFGNHVLQRLEAQQRCARVKFEQCLRLTVTDTPNVILKSWLKRWKDKQKKM